MLPERFIQRLPAQSYIDPDALLKALEEPSPVSIRINPLKWSRVPLIGEPVQWCRSGFYLDARPSFTTDPLFHAGCYYPQEASGMFLGEAIRQTAGPLRDLKVLDLCGAPGGKSTHLAEMIGPGSLLVANEVIRSRAPILAETITKWGTDNTIVTRSDPSAFGRMECYFDIIVVDAPCSGEGMFRDPLAAEEWSVENAIHCSERQKRILTDVWPALKRNGTLIYSTCTFNPGENEENIRWLIRKYEAECLRLNVSGFPGIKEIDYNGIYGYGFYPGSVRGEGFFISVIRKTDGTQGVKIRSDGITDLRPAAADIALCGKWTGVAKDRLLRWKDEVFAIPCNAADYFFLLKNLKIVRKGTIISKVKNNDYLPTHELALSGLLKKDSFPRIGLSLGDAVSYLRRDNLSLPEASGGWNILTYKDVNIGFIKNIGRRVNNYFPVEWRIRMDKPVTGEENIIKWE